ncbi:MAG: hypothetical protein K2I48_09575 [Muribaculaceae bacterium]|nr:hypothetical protein [Muribaculaceae bacterium]
MTIYITDNIYNPATPLRYIKSRNPPTLTISRLAATATHDPTLAARSRTNVGDDVTFLTSIRSPTAIFVIVGECQRQTWRTPFRSYQIIFQLFSHLIAFYWKVA